MFFLLFFLLFIPISVQAEIFQWVDSKGNRHFSDRVHQGAEVLQLNPGYSYYQIKKVYDGDTVLLSNGKKIRLLGINTPEIEGRYKLAQPGGEEAKHWLLMKLNRTKVRLEMDVEKQDKYGRLLAHIFTEDKQHINLELVKNGLATVNIHPPNLKYTDDLLQAQQLAEQSLVGIWKYKEYQPKNVSEIKQSGYRGWHRIIGLIKNIHHTRKYSYLNLTDTFALKIEKKLLNLFPDLNSYIGKKLEVRGWVNRNKNHYSLLVRHPSVIQVISLKN